MEFIGEVLPAVTAAQFKSAVHLPAGAEDDDWAIDLALFAAQEMVMTATGRPLTPCQVQFDLPAGWARWWVPVLPISEVVAIEGQSAGGVWSDLSVEGVILRDAFSAPCVDLSQDWTGHDQEATGLRITVLAGYENNAPAQLRQAIILLAKEWFEAGISVEDQAKLDLSFGASRLIKQVRYRTVKRFDWGV
jgi:uncharacterized phiE125 gp8 family phage protein